MAKGDFKEVPEISNAERMKILRDQNYKCNHCYEEFTSTDMPVLDNCHYNN